MLAAARACGIRTAEFRLRGRFDADGIQQIRDFLQKRQVRVVHCHGYKADAYGWLASRRLPVARIATCHGWTAHTGAVRIYEALDKSVFLRAFHRVIAVSGPIQKGLLRRGHRKNKIVLIPNGLDLSRFPFRQGRASGPLGVPARKEIIVSVGRLSPEKGHVHLLHAAGSVLRERPEALFVLVGAGLEEKVLARLADDLGVADRVLLAGARSDVSEVLAQCDVFVNPSLKEGLPMAVLEAMAVGVPVVATSVGDVPEVVKDGETGLLVPAGDAEALARGILRVLTDPQEAASRAGAARTLVEREYPVQRMAVRTEEVYVEALESLGLLTATE